MNCSDCQDRIHAFLDGELPSTVADRVQAHLDACAPCFRRSQVEEAFRRALRENLKPAPPSPELEARVLAGLDALDARRDAAKPDGDRPEEPLAFERGERRRRRWVGWGLAAAASLAGLLVLAPQLDVVSRDGAVPATANPIQLQGRLTCLGCLLAHSEHSDGTGGALLPPGVTGAVDHSRLHDRLQLEVEGRLWDLAPVGSDAGGIFDHDNVGRDVVVVGTALPDWNVVEVGRLHFL